jgi:hypothetical protein
MEGGVDHTHPGITVLPVVPQLGLPSEICDLVDGVHLQLMDHIPVVHVEHNQSFDSRPIQGRNVRPSDLHNLGEFEVESGVELIQCLRATIDRNFRVVCPEGHGDAEHGHPATIPDPLCSLDVAIVLEGTCGHLTDAFDHGAFGHQQPLIDIAIGCIGIDYGEEFHVFALTGVHTINFLALVEFQLLDAFEAFLEMGLHTGGIFGLGQNFKEFVVGKEVEAREGGTLTLQVIIESSLDTI